jgi:hypothetical protein
MSTPYATPPVTPVVPAKSFDQPKPDEKQVTYADAQREADAAALSVTDAENQLKAALQVRALKANIAVEAGVRQSTAKHDAERVRINDLAFKANADAIDRAKSREQDVPYATSTAKTLPVSRLPIANEGSVLLNTQDRLVPPLSK